VRCAPGGLKEKIFVAEYRVKLPSEKCIKEGLEALNREHDAQIVHTQFCTGYSLECARYGA
jgi:hypothetical protein